MVAVTSVIMKNIKFRIREPQQYLFVVGFPIMFLALFYFMFGNTQMNESLTIFDYYIWGLLGFITTFAVQSASIAFSLEKESGTLKRLRTTPVGSSYTLFIGFIISELIIVTIQLVLIYFISFFLLNVYFTNIVALLITLVMYLLYSFICIGIGLIFAALLNGKLAGQIPMLVIMPFIFLSGSIMPLDLEIIYLNPLFWVHQFSVYIAYSGGNNLFGKIGLINFMDGSISSTNLSVFWAIPIVIFMGVLFMMVGITIYQKKSQ